MNAVIAQVRQRRIAWRAHLASWSWIRAIAMVGFIALNGMAYFTYLGRDGLGNPFYAAAVQSGAHSLHNAFFAAITFGGTMSVDKPPLALWAMELSVRVFGWSSFGLMFPSAVAGLVTNLSVFAVVRQWSNFWWGLLAGLIVLVTPMSLVMFRFNNPDAVLTLMETLCVVGIVSALKRERWWKFALAGVAIGLAVLTKLLAGLLVLPVLLAAYMVLAHVRWPRRILNMCIFVAAAAVAAGWWFVVVAMTPVMQRPWIDGTADSSPFTLLISNNVQHLSSQNGVLRASPRGILRMFNTQELPNYSWWIFLAVTTAVLACAIVIFRAVSTRRLVVPGMSRALLVAFAVSGSGLFMCGVFSFMTGSYHSYYAVEAVPMLAVGSALTMACVWSMTTAGSRMLAFALLAVAVLAFDDWVLARQARPTHYAIEAFALTSVLLVALHRNRSAVAAVALGCLVVLAPVGYTLHTWLGHHEGGSPVGGPNGNQVAFDDFAPVANHFGYPSQVSPGLRRLLLASQGFEYAAAIIRDGDAASIQLATGVRVFPVGGYRTVPPGGLDTFKALILGHRIHFYIPTEFGPPLPDWVPMQRWIERRFELKMVSTQQVYDLSKPSRPLRTTADQRPGKGRPAARRAGSVRPKPPTVRNVSKRPART